MLKNNDAAKMDSFGRWMDKEMGGDCDDSLMALDSSNYSSPFETENDDKEISSLSHHMQLPDSVGPSLSQEQLYCISDFAPDWAYSGEETKFDSTSRMGEYIDFQEPTRSTRQKLYASEDELVQKRTSADFNQGGTLQTPSPSQSTVPFHAKDMPTKGGNPLGPTVGRINLNNFDLNNAYDDSQDCMELVKSFDALANVGATAGGCSLWLRQDSHKSSPPQTSGNLGSTATQSPSSSSGEAQSCTDRIVIKLFGKDPSEFPLVLRNQILDWLSHSPTNIESYIRPGCIIPTMYLRMENSSWEELCFDLSSSLINLVDASSDSFWRKGWVNARVLHHVAFVCDGQVVLNTPLPLRSNTTCRILSIKPIAVPVSERAQFSVEGYNLSQSTSRLRCALEGKSLVQTRSDVMEGAGLSVKHEDAQFLGFSCSIPDVSGRGFTEIEDDSLSSSFFPFIVAESDVCSEICTLESVLEVAGTADDIQEAGKIEPRNLALNFINEIRWLLYRRRLKFRLAHMDPTSDLFLFKGFRWLMEFSIDHDWCAVVKKLLGILFSCKVDLGEYPSIELALGEIGLLHRAVRTNCRPMVEFLLNYNPEMFLDNSGSEEKDSLKGGFIFRPDAVGPGQLTPLHVAASRDGSENVLDALTNDPHLVGIEAWRNARDSAGLTPNDYASLRGHYTYTHLIQRKIDKKAGSVYVVVDIPTNNLANLNSKQKAAATDNLDPPILPTPKVKAAVGYEWVIGPIVAAGVSLNSRDLRDWASIFYREETVVTLIRLGAASGAVEDPTLAVPGGKTAADLASSRGYKGIAGYSAEADLTSHLQALSVNKNVVANSAAAIAAENATEAAAQSVLPSNRTRDEQCSLRGSLAAFRQAAYALAFIQDNFLSCSFGQRHVSESSGRYI